jgi:hypothetical protein
MTSADIVRGRSQRARLAPREYVTGLSSCRAVAVLADAPVAVLADNDQFAVVDLDTGACETHPVPWDDSAIRSLVGLTGRRVLAVDFHRVALCRLGEHGVVPVRHWRIECDTSVLDVAATAAGSRFVVAAGDRFYLGDVDRPDLAEFGSPDRTDIGTAGCLAACVSPSGDTVAVGRVGAVDVYAAAGMSTAAPLSPSQVLRVNTNGVPVLSAGMSPDGRHLAAGDDVTATVMFDVERGSRVQVSEGGKVIAVRWSPDGSVCALVALTRSVGLVDPAGRLLAELEPAERGTYYFIGGGWTVQGDRFVVGTEHGKLLAWAP